MSFVLGRIPFAMLETLIQTIDLGYFEIGEAFNGLEDENLWRRPHRSLLSIGEIAGHVAYWEAVRFGGAREDGSSDRDLSNCKITSPLLDPHFGYYPSSLRSSVPDLARCLSAERVYEEVVKVHREAMNLFKELNPELTAVAPYWNPNSNYRELLMYMAFHVAYHTGQVYTARHLFGEITPDN